MRKAPYKRVDLTPQQQRMWEDTLGALSWIAPGFIHVLYTMLASSGHKDTALFTEELQTEAGTDGFQIMLRPSGFFKYDLLERCFIVLHEVMHEMLNHVRMGYALHVKGVIKLGNKELPYDHDHANTVQDYIINAILIASNLGKFHKNWLHDPAVATDQDQWVEVYFRWWQDKPKLGGGGATTYGDGAPSHPQAFDGHFPPGESTGEDPSQVPERNEAQWEIVTKQAMEIQEAHGKLPGSLKQFFDTLLQPKVDWTDHVRGLILRIAGSGAYDWRKLDRRLIVRGIGSPGMTGHGAGLVMVGGDSSGSIFVDKTLTHRFLAEIAGMLEDVQPEEVRVLWCDTKVRRVDICHDVNDVRKMAYEGVPGGGGTSFLPVFRYIEREELRPDALIYLTDGYGEFPKKEPDYPVIWGSITDAPYPFGTVVRVPTYEAD